MSSGGGTLVVVSLREEQFYEFTIGCNCNYIIPFLIKMKRKKMAENTSCEKKAQICSVKQMAATKEINTVAAIPETLLAKRAMTIQTFTPDQKSDIYTVPLCRQPMCFVKPSVHCRDSNPWAPLFFSSTSLRHISILKGRDRPNEMPRAFLLSADRGHGRPAIQPPGA